MGWLNPSSCRTALLARSQVTLLQAGFWHLSRRKHEKNRSRGKKFCPDQLFKDETRGKEVAQSTCQPPPPATHFLLLTLLFFVMLSACCLRRDERFLIVMAYSSRDKRVYSFLILDVLKTLYLHPATFKRRQKVKRSEQFFSTINKTTPNDIK